MDGRRGYGLAASYRLPSVYGWETTSKEIQVEIVIHVSVLDVPFVQFVWTNLHCTAREDVQEHWHTARPALLSKAIFGGCVHSVILRLYGIPC